jgi:septal ring factor EnvC (AmiA/AmiB activator)
MKACHRDKIIQHCHNDIRLPCFHASLVIPVFLLLLSLFLMAAPHAVSANPLEKLSDIKKKLESTIEEAQETKRKEHSVRSSIDTINQSIHKKEQELKNYDRNMAEAQSEIQNLSQEISMLTEKLDARKKYLKERIRSLYKRQYGGDGLVLISAYDYQDLTRKSKYISLLAFYDSKVLNKYSDDLQNINAKKRELDDMNNKLLASKNNALQKKKELQSDRSKKDETLARIRSIRLAKEKKIKELEESSRKLKEMIKKLNAKQIPQSIIGKGFESLKGSLPWPVQGGTLIQNSNQKESDEIVPVHEDGVTIEAGADNQAKSVAGGRVVYADSFKGFGMLVIIDHGSGYHSLYGNLQNFAIKTGDLLIEGMDVGTIRKAEGSESPSLYFELRYKGKPINPLKWLKNRSIRHGGYAAE